MCNFLHLTQAAYQLVNAGIRRTLPLYFPPCQTNASLKVIFKRFSLLRTKPMLNEPYCAFSSSAAHCFRLMRSPRHQAPSQISSTSAAQVFSFVEALASDYRGI